MALGLNYADVIVIWDEKKMSVAMRKTQITVFNTTQQKLCNISLVILKKLVVLWFI